MKILSVASELFPLVKTGGLADVAGALPLALAPLGITVRTLLPGYPSVMAKLTNPRKIADLPALLGEPASILFVKHADLELYILDAPFYFDREGGPYTDVTGLDHDDNWRRFAALSLAGAELANELDPNWSPDLVHVHDWQAALTPVYLKYSPRGAHIPSVITIHNIAFQGQFSPAIFPELSLPEDAFDVAGVEYYGDVGFLKGGMRTAWALTTVSPTYASEILEPQFGMGLQGLVAERVEDLVGIVNGIDDDVWNPATDKHITQTYDASSLKKRADNRKALCSRFGLTPGSGPVFCVISRLTWQKGIDLIVAAADFIVENGGSLAILGSGDPALEAALKDAAAHHPGRISVIFGYDEPLSHLMQAGSDAILIPSRFEPCGLTQLYGLRYGCIPVVGHTGGLADTIIDANGAAISAKAATGVEFTPVTAEGLIGALRRTFRLFAEPKTWTGMQKAAMKADVSWASSARQYADLYKTLLTKVHKP
ncbi:glycogen synthase GlgA [Rhizobium sp. KVB221]|uniref:Glycogen synthase n=1 Tax=Rhizobium setariae TaxID=2801340 RepID=A0A937CPA0_9HYPH|nr:glycogen synthase GlgA [Rhizobium setariae]MBL0372218.1 glycogen synthase GlgA [Rhizobium setariae]